MKIRNSFVSNSSSSSFIIIGDKNLPNNVNFIELNERQKGRILNIMGMIKFQKMPKNEQINNNKVFLTPYCYRENIDDVQVVYGFMDGDIGGPYHRENFDEIAENIWFPKEGYEDKK